MNKHTLFYGAIIIALMSLCFLFILRIVPSAQFWDNYNVLYVDNNADVSIVKADLQKYPFEGIIYPDHSNFPLPSKLAPVQYHQFSSGFTYEDLQSLYFTDKDNLYNLFYIEKNQTKMVSQALQDVSYEWGLDSQASIPFLPFIITLLFSCILMLYSKDKLFFLCMQIPLVLYTFASPFYHIAVSVCVIILAFFMLQKFWNRKHFEKKVFTNIFSIVSTVLLIIASLLLGFKGFILLLLTSLLSASMYYILYTYKHYKYNKSVFKPLPIHTAQTINNKVSHSFKFLLMAFFIVVSLSTLSLSNIQPQKKNTQKALHIPSPSGYTITDNFSIESYEQVISEYTDSRLPDLTDFVSTAWYFETYPFLKLEQKIVDVVTPGATINTIDYVKNGNALEEKIKTVAIFDDAYIQRIVSLALTTVNSGAEKLLASQNGFSRVSYATSGTIANPTGSVIFLLIVCAYVFYTLLATRIKRL